MVMLTNFVYGSHCMFVTELLLQCPESPEKSGGNESN